MRTCTTSHRAALGVHIRTPHLATSLQAWARARALWMLGVRSSGQYDSHIACYFHTHSHNIIARYFSHLGCSTIDIIPYVSMTPLIHHAISHCSRVTSITYTPPASKCCTYLNEKVCTEIVSGWPRLKLSMLTCRLYSNRFPGNFNYAHSKCGFTIRHTAKILSS